MALAQAWKAQAQEHLQQQHEEAPPLPPQAPPTTAGNGPADADEAVEQQKPPSEHVDGEGGVCELDGTPFSTYYGQLQHQQNMLQDVVRTGMYQHAFAQNVVDFNEATVLDVGTGTGVLAFFAVQAGARKVYGVEQAERMAVLARKLIAGNHLEDRIEIVQSSVEESTLPVPQVDIIVSEPLGFLLVHERMLESFVRARDMYLKPGGLMMPTTGVIEFAPLTDEALWQEQLQKAQFWTHNSFYGMDLSCLHEQAMEEYFGQAVVGYFSPACLLSSGRASHHVDFQTVTLPALQQFTVPLHFTIERTAIMHGLAGWFDVHFLGSQAHVTLTTSPAAAGTHWYQCRLLLKEPIAVNATQEVAGSLHFVANSKVSYTITMTLQLVGTNITSTSTVRLQDQHYSYLTPGQFDHTTATATDHTQQLAS